MRGRIKLAGLIWACWTLVAIFAGSRHYLTEVQRGAPVDAGRVLLVWLVCFYSWALLTPGIFWVTRRFPLSRGQRLRGLLVHIPVSLGCAAATTLATTLFSAMIPRPPGSLEPTVAERLLALGNTELLIYWAVVLVGLGFDHYHRHQRQELQTARLRTEAAELQASLRQAQLEALSRQLQPHFLFNALNTIAVLMREDPEAAGGVLLKLSELLRAALKNDSHEVALRDELALLRSYLAIEQIRYQDRLQVRFVVDPAALDARVPHLVLQPLVENAIKHAVAPFDRPCAVEVSVALRAHRIELAVRDDGPGLDGGGAGGNGVGLSNTRARLEVLYGQDYRLSLASPDGGGVTVHLALPYRPAMAAPGVS